MVMEMPRRAGKHGRFLANSSDKVDDGMNEIICRVVPILERWFSTHPKLVVHQVIVNIYRTNIPYDICHRNLPL